MGKGMEIFVSTIDSQIPWKVNILDEKACPSSKFSLAWGIGYIRLPKGISNKSNLNELHLIGFIYEILPRQSLYYAYLIMKSFLKQFNLAHGTQKFTNML